MVPPAKTLAQTGAQSTDVRLLQALQRFGPQSRAQLARQLGVMRSTIGTQVTKLMDAGILQDAAAGNVPAGGVGRPGSAIDFNPDHRSFAGIDVGVGHFRAVLTDLGGAVRTEIATPLAPDAQSPDAIVGRLVETLRALKRDAPTLNGVTISVPGVVNKSGQVLRLPFLDWRDVQLRDRLARELPDFGPINIENDANIFARGELLTQKVDASSAIYFWMDAGIGAGIAFNATLLTGTNGQAGEIGHIFVRAGSGANRLRLEDNAGQTAVLEAARAAGLPVKSLSDFIEAAASDAPGARDILDGWTSVMSETISSLCSIFDPEVVVFSGPMTDLLRMILPDVERRAQAHLFHGTALPALHLRDHEDLMLARACAEVERNAFLTDRDPGPQIDATA